MSMKNTLTQGFFRPLSPRFPSRRASEATAASNIPSAIALGPRRHFQLNVHVYVRHFFKPPVWQQTLCSQDPPTHF